MPTSQTRFTGERAPCGQTVDGERYLDQDDDCLVRDELVYSCGCKSIRHEYHDGSVSHTVVRHDGAVLEDESAAER